MTQQPTLVIMAAGMGSRFGGLKQMTPVDEAGHFIIDFSLYDAYQAGFRRVVFIIKHEIEETFRQTIGARMEKWFHVDYVYQELDCLPAGFAVPAGRKKPWGTDEEGGTVSRVGSNPAMQAIAAPSAQSLGEQADPAAVYQAGQDIGGSLHAVGFNMDFAPVADVSSGPSSVIGSRSFGTDAQLCASLVSVITGSLRAEEIIPCLKHFPGYGSAPRHRGSTPFCMTETLCWAAA